MHQERGISIPISECSSPLPRETEAETQLVPYSSSSCGSEEHLSRFSFEGFCSRDRMVARLEVLSGDQAGLPDLQIEMFVSQENHKLPCFVTPYLHKKAVATDAMSMDWNRWN